MLAPTVVAGANQWLLGPLGPGVGVGVGVGAGVGVAVGVGVGVTPGLGVTSGCGVVPGTIAAVGVGVVAVAVTVALHVALIVPVASAKLDLLVLAYALLTIINKIEADMLSSKSARAPNKRREVGRAGLFCSCFWPPCLETGPDQLNWSDLRCFSFMQKTPRLAQQFFPDTPIPLSRISTNFRCQYNQIPIKKHNKAG